MNEKQIQGFGCFIGIMAALVAYLLVDNFFEISVWVGYVVFLAAATVFGVIGVVFSKLIKPRK